MNKKIAHRGIFDNIDIPENSLKAFEKAIKYNYPIELDIQLTKDNKLIVFHDENLKRMSNINKNIKDISIQEINEYKLLNTDETIPTLSDVLNLVQGKILIIIEIKNIKNYKKLISILRHELKTYNGEIIIQSFHSKVINKIKRYYTSGLLLTSKYKNLKYNIIFHTIQQIYCKPDFISINYKLLKYKYYKNLANKYKTYIWTIKRKEDIDKYKAENYNYICNNLPY